MPATQSLLHRRHPLADPGRQLDLLAFGGRFPAFAEILKRHGQAPLTASGVQVLQINVGKVCNQTCQHCHVDAGPDRRETMSWGTMQACLDAVARGGIPVVDITGGAPEMNPHFRRLVLGARRLGAHVIDRCNLTILLAPGFDDLPEFLAEQRVEVIASLPCYLAENTDRQRGSGVFDASIQALRRLNALGYGHEGTGLALNLVYNPIGPKLPPDQAALEASYRQELATRHGIVFTHLYTLTNMPISRFLEDLVLSSQHEAYMEILVAAFNPAAVAGLMCRNTLSVGWDGRLHDCDFHQMLNLTLAPGLPHHIADFDPARLDHRAIVTAPHCFGCTAGAGSSCQGATVGLDRPEPNREPSSQV